MSNLLVLALCGVYSEGVQTGMVDLVGIEPTTSSMPGKELYVCVRRHAPVNISTEYPQFTTNTRLVYDRTLVYSRVHQAGMTSFLPSNCRKFGGSAVE
jgi:hypothetical protein